MKRTAHRLRERCGPYADEVCEKTGLSKDALAELIYEMGMEFLQTNGLQQLAKRRDFWKDFMHHWYCNDFKFLVLERTQTAARYRQFHREVLDTYSINLKHQEVTYE